VLVAHDTEVALAAAAALVNTAADADPRDEALTDIAALDDYVRTWGWTGERRSDAEVRDVRPRRIWEVDEDEVVQIVNQLLQGEGAAAARQA
jgi:hypothetical protein